MVVPDRAREVGRLRTVIWSRTVRLAGRERLGLRCIDPDGGGGCTSPELGNKPPRGGLLQWPGSVGMTGLLKTAEGLWAALNRQGRSVPVAADKNAGVPPFCS